MCSVVVCYTYVFTTDNILSLFLSLEPDEQAPPIATPISSTSIRLTWFEPEAPNGLILNYTVYRDSAPIATVTTLTYTDTNLRPNTQYLYSIEAFNSVGSTQSVEMTVQTLEGVPEGIDAPILTALSANSIQAMWVEPATPNGIVNRYEIVMVIIGGEQVIESETSVANTTGDMLSVIVLELEPFTVYDFLVRACTSGGCGSSETSEVETLQAPPTFQPLPNVTTISSQELFVSWVVSPIPNGIVSNYEVFQRESPFTGVGVSIVNTSQLSFLVGGLRSFVRYEFSVRSFTAGGSVVSDWGTGTTAEDGEYFSLKSNWFELSPHFLDHTLKILEPLFLTLNDTFTVSFQLKFSNFHRRKFSYVHNVSTSGTRL